MLKRLRVIGAVLAVCLISTGGVGHVQAIEADTGMTGDVIYKQVVSGTRGAFFCFGGCAYICCKIVEPIEPS